MLNRPLRSAVTEAVRRGGLVSGGAGESGSGAARAVTPLPSASHANKRSPEGWIAVKMRAPTLAVPSGETTTGGPNAPLAGAWSASTRVWQGTSQLIPVCSDQAIVASP